MSVKIISSNEVAEHNSAESVWMVIKGKVYDVTKFLNEHPGGEEVLLEQAGKDASIPFYDVGHSSDAVTMLEDYLIGELSEGDKPKPAPAANKSSKPGASFMDIMTSPTWTNFLIPSAIGCVVFALYKTAIKLLA